MRRFAAALALILYPGVSRGDVPLGSDFAASAKLDTLFAAADWAAPPDTNERYEFSRTKLNLGLKYQIPGFRAYAEGQANQGLGFPEQGVGIGGAYFSQSDDRSSPGSAYFRQLNVRYAPQIDQIQSSLLVGRFLYQSGVEKQTDNPELDALKQRRLSERMLSSYDFTFGRSFDGARLDAGNHRIGSITAAAMRPTSGFFAVDGNDQIDDVSIATTALTSAPDLWPGQGEFQTFYYFYRDERGAVPTDNRSIDEREAVANAIELHTFGAHWVQLYPADSVTFSSLVWAAAQTGRWANLDQRSYAFAVEGGVRADQVWSAPELTVGWDYSSGDDSSANSTHGTFYPLAPAVRRYALIPAYNFMNTSDVFTELRADVTPSVQLQSGFHSVYLSNSEDLLYTGAGVSVDSAASFGVAGTPSGGASHIGSVLDFAISYRFAEDLIGRAYYGHLFGGAVLEPLADSDIDFTVIEMNYKL